MLKFTSEHEWLEIEGTTATVGITDFAQGALGDVVYVELPPVGKVVKKRDETAVVESVKAASDVYAPISGKIIAVNEALIGNPGLVNSAPEGDGWFFKLEVSDESELGDLLDQAAYQTHVKELS